jgi:hypothetical protein
MANITVPRTEDLPYRVFTGADIVAYINERKAATLQAVTVTIARQTVPIYVMSEPNPVAFARGRRSITGNLVFSQFDRHAVLHGIFDLQTPKTTIGDLPRVETNYYGSTGLVKTANPGFPNTFSNTNLDETPFSVEATRQVAELVRKRRVLYVDQLPPFDITITMVNEEGHAAVASINGVILINESWGYTLDDITADVVFTYMARSVTPLTSLVTGEQTSVTNAMFVSR